jgi:signal transduction histidine kinase
VTVPAVSGKSGFSDPLPEALESEVRALRRYVRDLSALLALPVLWRARAPRQMVESFADVLHSLLRLDFVWVRLRSGLGELTAEAVRAPAASGALSPQLVLPPELLGAHASHLRSPSEPLTHPGLLGFESIRLTRVRPGRQSDDWLVIAGSARSDFPNEQERFLLQVAADQAATLVETAILYEAEHRARLASEEAREEAVAANQAKSDFLAAMSHELRTPLNAIAGYTQLLELGVQGPVTHQQQEALGRIQRSQEHLLALITDVLNFAKLEAGRVEYELENVPLAAAVADVGSMIEPQLTAKGLAYAVRVGGDTAVRADRDKLQQVMLNLLSNAIKFTDTGGRVIIDTAPADESPEGMVVLRVTDTGIGIPPDKHEAIFDPFVQVRHDPRRRAEGMGLGLAISRDLARGMGGDLAVQDAPGAGSQFVLTLPAAGRRR